MSTPLVLITKHRFSDDDAGAARQAAHDYCAFLRQSEPALLWFSRAENVAVNAEGR
jgi:hypothetical protein